MSARPDVSFLREILASYNVYALKVTVYETSWPYGQHSRYVFLEIPYPNLGLESLLRLFAAFLDLSGQMLRYSLKPGIDHFLHILSNIH
jgi:hypothetical protein